MTEFVPVRLGHLEHETLFRTVMMDFSIGSESGVKSDRLATVIGEPNNTDQISEIG